MIAKKVKCKECGTVREDVTMSVSYDVTGNGGDREMLVWQCQLKRCKVRNVFDRGLESRTVATNPSLTPAEKSAITRAKNKVAKELEADVVMKVLKKLKTVGDTVVDK